MQTRTKLRFTLICSAFAVGSAAADGPNVAFGDNGWSLEKFFAGAATNRGNDVALQADGKIVVVGYNSTDNDDAIVVRYNTDGSLDSTFDGDGKVVVDAGGEDRGNAVALQDDGKIVVAGSVDDGNDIDFIVYRLNTDGSPDVSFGVGGIATTGLLDNNQAYDVLIRGNGKIILIGQASNGLGTNQFAIAQFNTDGSLDTTFSADGLVMADVASGQGRGRAGVLQADGKIVVGGSAGFGQQPLLARFNTDGSLDTSFGFDGIAIAPLSGDFGSLEDLAIQADQKIVALLTEEIEGGPPNFEFYLNMVVARFNTDGSPDNSFDADARADIPPPADDAYANSIAMQADSKILVGGASTHIDPNNAQRFFVARLNSDGSPDLGFDIDGYAETELVPNDDSRVSSLAVQGDGKIVAIGTSIEDIGVARYDTDGGLDTGFSDDGVLTTAVDALLDAGYRSLQVQADGKIVVGGWSIDAGGDYEDSVLARLNTDGSLDSTFGGDGKVTMSLSDLSESFRSIAIQADGKILAVDAVRASLTSDAALVRFNSDGSLDTGFAGGTVVSDFLDGDVWNDVAVQSDEQILVAGGDVDNIVVARFNTDGTPDVSFNTTGNLTLNLFGSAKDIHVLGNGKILVSGYRWENSQYNICVARFESNGLLDTTFGDGDGWFQSTVGGASELDEPINPTALQADGKIIVAGQVWNGSDYDVAVSRYTAEGVLDTTFDSDGFATLDVLGSNDTMRDVFVEAGGNIVLGGYAGGVTGRHIMTLLRFSPDGSLDLTYGADGFYQFEAGDFWHYATALAQVGEHTYMAGGVGSYAAVLDIAPEGAGPTNTESVLLRRESDNRWFNYELTGSNVSALGRLEMTRSPDYSVVSRADFDGDGLPDLLVRDTVGGENGRWVMYTLDGMTINTQGFVDLTRNQDWDIKATEDFDGDGNADILLRNTLNNRWLMYRMNGQQILQQQTVVLSTDPTDVYVGSGDFDGDGDADVLLRRADSSWLMFQMAGISPPAESTPTLTTNSSFSLQTIADFNADGRDDILLRRNDGRWFMYLMNGATIDDSGAPAMTENVDFTLQSASDFNGDVAADVLLRRSDGRWFMYTMNGLTIGNSGPVDMTRNLEFQIVSTQDFGGDGHADVLLRRTDGRWVLYEMDGPTILDQGIPDMTRNTDWVPFAADD